MTAYLFFNIIMCAGALAFAISLNTKRGKKWMKEL